MATTTTDRGTCQICLRSIGTKTGLIAHHGYRRPHQGWQTSSCFGAKYRPLEVACDAIPVVIKGLEQHIDRVLASAAELKANPPAEIVERDSHGRVRHTLVRPEGFDVAAPAPGSYRPGSDDHYRSNFQGQLRQLTTEAKLCRSDISLLTERLENWIPSTTAVEG